jgi:putative hydrolase of the HAD superfamily
MKPAFLYFDLGNVLLSFSHDQMCRQMAEVAGVSAEAVREVLFSQPKTGGGHSVQWRFERGDLNALAVYENFCEELGVRPDQEKLAAAGCNIFHEMPESIALVQRLAAARVPLGIMSNTNPIDWGFITSGAFPVINRCFERYVLSFEVRAMKPDQAIYEHAVRLAGAPAREVFFTDDRPENVAGAIDAGLNAVLFTTPAELACELKRRGFDDVLVAH